MTCFQDGGTRMNDESKFLIGKIKYTNAWPVFYYFDPTLLGINAQFVVDVPSHLNQLAIQRKLHVTAMSSFAYAQVAEHFMLLPDISVSTKGAVQSILLFAKRPIEQLMDATIAITNTSATSAHLLYVLMTETYGATPKYVRTQPILHQMMKQADAALLIGDHAIQASWTAHPYYQYDLAALWKEWTGYNMTFAVWAVQKKMVSFYPNVVRDIANAFVMSKQRSLNNLTPIVDRAQQKLGGDQRYWHAYFSNLCYDFGEKQQQGLRVYFQYARKFGWLDQEVDIELWQDNIHCTVRGKE